MDTKSLQSRYPALLEYMKAIGYHHVTIARFHAEIKRIIRFASSPEVKSYDDFYEKMYGKSVFGVPAWKSREKKRLLNQIRLFDEENIFPDNTFYRVTSARSCYNQLLPEFKSIADYIGDVMAKRRLKPTTIATTKNCIGAFFLTICNNNKVSRIHEIDEDMVSRYFIRDNKLYLCSGSVCRIKRALLDASGHKYGAECARIAKFIPKTKRIQRMYPGLSEENKEKVEQYILDETNKLSNRDRAIMLLIYYTGLRSCDVANLKIDNLDWQRGLLLIEQQKTGAELKLKLEPIIGNAIYNYITTERHKVNIPNIFLAADHHHRAVKPGTIGAICTRVMTAAGIDVESCRTGTHVFRHKVATDLIETGINIPTISALLGHTKPQSVNHYVGSTYHRLKQCALSIEDYPIRKEGLS